MSEEKFKRTLFKLARSNASGLFIGFAFENLSSLIPVDKIAENEYVIAFYHPVKHWERHVLVVPKKAIRNFLDIDLKQLENQNILITTFSMATEVAKKLDLERFTVLVNGGEYQDVPQVHFHLASGKDKYGNESGQERNLPESGELIYFESELTTVQKMTGSDGKEHLIFTPKIKTPSIQSLDLNDEKSRGVVLDMAKTAQKIIRKINPRGYTFLTNENGQGTLSFHLLFER